MKNNNSNNLFDTFSSFSSSSSNSFSYLINKESLLSQKKLMNINNDPENHETHKKSTEDLEISVFGAEKYFNGDMDSDHSQSPKFVSQPLINPEVVPLKRISIDPKQSSKNFSETPSLRSESSWNSQSLLVKNKNSLSNKKVNHKKSFLTNLGCRCVCSDVNSLDVVVDEKRSSGLKKIKTQLSFSDLKKKNQQQKQEEMLLQRKSLDIYGSPVIDKRVVQKKLTVFPWEYSSSAKQEDCGFSMKYNQEEEDGSLSDESSDLFEIESLTGKHKGSDDPESPNCYAPSEVSIEWSVVTASVADFSIMSECATSPVRNQSFQIPTAKSNKETAPQRRKSSSGGLLLGCKSHKSVRVSGDSYRSIDRTSNYVPRFPMESVETRRKMSNSSVSQSQSPFMYIQ